jgi:DNA-binding transcriptional regulator YbjK
LEPIYDLLDRTEEILEDSEAKRTIRAKLKTIQREAQSILRDLQTVSIPEVSRVRDLAEALVRAVRKSSMDMIALKSLRAQAKKIERRRNNQRAIVALLLST